MSCSRWHRDDEALPQEPSACSLLDATFEPPTRSSEFFER